MSGKKEFHGAYSKSTERVDKVNTEKAIKKLNSRVIRRQELIFGPVMKWTTLLVFLTLGACKSESPACPVTAAGIRRQVPKPLLAEMANGHEVTALYDSGWDSAGGGAYLFYPNGNLRSYSFYQRNKTLVYSEVFDEQGRLLHAQGSPMVDRLITQVGEDSAYVRIYFYNLGKEYRDLEVKINEKPPMHFAVRPDSVFAHLDRVSFGLNIMDMPKLNMYSHIAYTDQCTHVEHILSDSIFLIRNPDLSPANR